MLSFVLCGFLRPCDAFWRRWIYFLPVRSVQYRGWTGTGKGWMGMGCGICRVTTSSSLSKQIQPGAQETVRATCPADEISWENPLVRVIKR